MSKEFRVTDWADYRMDYSNPHAMLETDENEVAVVDAALDALVAEGMLPHRNYDNERMLAHREAVRDRFEIPWTAISPRMQRFIYAVNAIHQPAHMIAAGVFCGNTFISNAGAAVGPGSCYDAAACVGIEIRPEEAERAERNVRALDATGTAKVVAADAVDYVRDYDGPINLLYLDADGDARRGKGIYFDILESAWDKMPEGALILAHNSVNGGEKLQQYLQHVRNGGPCRASINVILDPEGLEVTAK